MSDGSARFRRLSRVGTMSSPAAMIGDTASIVALFFCNQR